MTWELKCDDSKCRKVLEFSDAVLLKNVRCIDGKFDRHFCSLDCLLAWSTESVK
jgi:hypothetical protein